MKLAVLIDYLEGRGGGEKIAYYLAKNYDADIYTAVANWERILPEFKQMSVNVLNVPRTEMIKQEFAIRKFRSLDLSRYDSTIGLGYYTIYSAVKNHPVIWYAYGTSQLYYRKGPLNLEKGPTRRIGKFLMKHRTKKIDKEAITKQVDRIVAISEYARKVIRNYYGRDTDVIQPPVEAERMYNKPPKDYYLQVARLGFGKRVELSIDAFKLLPDKKLYIEGAGDLKDALMKRAEGFDNIKFIGRMSTEGLLEHYANCIGLVCTAYHDEWSMPMVEAMASGKPCIAVNQGAFPEIVAEGKTGTLVQDTPEALAAGINKITPEVALRMKEDCIRRAREFDLSNFYRKWDHVLAETKKRG